MSSPDRRYAIQYGLFASLRLTQRGSLTVARLSLFEVVIASDVGAGKIVILIRQPARTRKSLQEIIRVIQTLIAIRGCLLCLNRNHLGLGLRSHLR